MSRRLCPSPCGSYTVRIHKDRIVVNCATCGDAGRYPPAGARRLAAALAGPLGRFETTAPRPERLRLAELLRKHANVLEAQRFAARRRRSRPSKPQPVAVWTAACGCSYQRSSSSSMNDPCPQHTYATNAARELAPARRSRRAR